MKRLEASRVRCENPPYPGLRAGQVLLKYLKLRIAEGGNWYTEYTCYLLQIPLAFMNYHKTHIKSLVPDMKPPASRLGELFPAL